MSREPFARYRELLDDAGFRPSRRLGQNFLLDPSLHRAIVQAAAPGPGDLVLEVGVGLGFLTRELAARAGCVLGVEVDERLLDVARADLEKNPPPGAGRIELLGLDVLGASGELHPALAEALAEEQVRHAGRLLLVANLPYAVSGPFLAAVATMARLPDNIVVLVQRELAERVAASPGGRDYGALSALLQALYRPELLRRVPAEVFRPRPRVESALLRLAPRDAEANRWPAARRRVFRVFLRTLFAQRRKTLRSNLPRALAAVERPDPGGWEPEQLARRPQELSAEELLGLWSRVPGRGTMLS